MRTWSLPLLCQVLRLALAALHILAAAASAAFKSRATLHLENLALRHQLGVLRRSVKRPKLTSADRLLWACLCGVWSDWRPALVIVKPETVIGWHRKGFRLYWTWKVRHGRPGRPPISKEVRKLIRTMSRENPQWGAPRIHGELLKLGIDIGETSVGKYIVRSQKPPSQNWRPFHGNQGSSVGAAIAVAERLRGTCHRHDSPRGPRPRDRSQRGFTVPSREITPGVLSRIQDAPLTGRGHTGAAASAAARTRRRSCHTTSWRTSPPLRATRSLNVASVQFLPR